MYSKKHKKFSKKHRPEKRAFFLNFSALVRKKSSWNITDPRRPSSQPIYHWSIFKREPDSNATLVTIFEMFFKNFHSWGISEKYLTCSMILKHWTGVVLQTGHNFLLTRKIVENLKIFSAFLQNYSEVFFQNFSKFPLLSSKFVELFCNFFLTASMKSMNKSDYIRNRSYRFGRSLLQVSK